MICNSCEIEKKVTRFKVFPYNGVDLRHVFLCDVDVVECTKCGTQTPKLKSPTVLMDRIRLAVLTQPALLGPDEIRFLRRSVRAKVQDWSKKVGIAEATYSKLENGHTKLSPKNDRLIRVVFTSTFESWSKVKFDLAATLSKITAEFSNATRNFAICVNVADSSKQVDYVPLDSAFLREKEASLIRAETKEPMTAAEVFVRFEDSQPEHQDHVTSRKSLTVCRNKNVSQEFAFAA